MKNTALVINTVSKNCDLWELFFGQLDKHFSKDIKRYVFVDQDDEKYHPIARLYFTIKPKNIRSSFLRVLVPFPKNTAFTFQKIIFYMTMFEWT